MKISYLISLPVFILLGILVGLVFQSFTDEFRIGWMCLSVAVFSITGWVETFVVEPGEIAIAAYSLSGKVIPDTNFRSGRYSSLFGLIGPKYAFDATEEKVTVIGENVCKDGDTVQLPVSFFYKISNPATIIINQGQDDYKKILEDDFKNTVNAFILSKTKVELESQQDKQIPITDGDSLLETLEKSGVSLEKNIDPSRGYRDFRNSIDTLEVSAEVKNARNARAAEDELVASKLRLAKTRLEQTEIFAKAYEDAGYSKKEAMAMAKEEVGKINGDTTEVKTNGTAFVQTGTSK